MIRALAMIALLAVACTRDAAPRPPVDNRGGAVAIDARAADARDSTCVDTCVRDHQMVAASIASIRESCVLSCATPTP